MAFEVIDSTGHIKDTLIGSSTFSKTTNTSTGSQNNLNVSVVGDTYCEWSGASDMTVTGISGGTSGTLLIVKNTGTKVAYFSHQSGSSSSENRFTNIATSSTTPISVGGSISYMHNGTNWILVGHEQGSYITPGFSAGDFTLNGDRTWTVDSGDVTTYLWKLSGRTLQVSWELVTTTISGGTSSTTAKIAIPNSYTATSDMLNLSTYFILQGANLFNGFASVAASGAVINAVKTDTTDFGTGTNNMYFYGQMTLQVT